MYVPVPVPVYRVYVWILLRGCKTHYYTAVLLVYVIVALWHARYMHVLVNSCTCLLLCVLGIPSMPAYTCIHVASASTYTRGGAAAGRTHAPRPGPGAPPPSGGATAYEPRTVTGAPALSCASTSAR